MSDTHQNQEEHADGIVEAGKPAPTYFYVLFFGLIIWGVIFMAYFLLSGWSSEAEFQEKMAEHTGQPVETMATASGSAQPAAEPDGKALFAASCAGCHGENATGGFGTDLTAASYQYGKSAEQVKESISAGRGDAMPGFSGQLSPAEIDKLVDFLLQL